MTSTPIMSAHSRVRSFYDIPRLINILYIYTVSCERNRTKIPGRNKPVTNQLDFIREIPRRTHGLESEWHIASMGSWSRHAWKSMDTKDFISSQGALQIWRRKGKKDVGSYLVQGLGHKRRKRHRNNTWKHTRAARSRMPLTWGSWDLSVCLLKITYKDIRIGLKWSRNFKEFIQKTPWLPSELFHVTKTTLIPLSSA